MKASIRQFVKVCFASLLMISKSFAMGQVHFSTTEMVLTLPSLSSQVQVALDEVRRDQEDPGLVYFRGEAARDIYIKLLVHYDTYQPEDYLFAIDYYSLRYDPENFKMNMIGSSEVICYLNRSSTSQKYDLFHCSFQIVGSATKALKVNFPRPRMGVSNNAAPMLHYLNLAL